MICNALLVVVGLVGVVDDAGTGASERVATPPPVASTPVVEKPTTKEEAEAAKSNKRFRRVAVYDLTLDGVDPRVGKFVTDAFVVELRKLDGISVVSMDEVRAMLAHEAQNQLMGCTSGESCMSEIGDALGADEILVGTLSQAAGSSVVTLRRIDQANARPMATITERLKPADGEEFLAYVGPAVEKLFPGHPLRGGVGRGVPAEQARKLNPPPLPFWAPVATGALAAVTLAGAASVGVAALNEETAQQALLDQAKEEAVPGKLVVDAGNRAQGYALTANVLYGAAAIVALAAGAMIPFTNFDPAPTE